MNATQRPTKKKRRLWKLLAAALILLCAWVGYGLFRMPDVPDLRDILPGDPYLVVEIRDAKTSMEEIERAAEPLQSVWLPLIEKRASLAPYRGENDEYGETRWILVSKSSPIAVEIEVKEIAAMLGEESALALYRGENGEMRWLLIAKPSLLARAQIAWHFINPWWKKEWGAEKETIGSIDAMRINGLPMPLTAAFDGRLGFAASDAELLEDAYERRLEDAFLVRDGAPQERLRAARSREQSDDRSASFYWAYAEGAYAFGEADISGGKWIGRAWVSSPGSRTEGAELSDTSDFRRRANRLINENAALAFWHTGVYDRAVMEAARGAGFTWEGGPDALIERPIGLYIPKAGGGGILPSLAFFVHVENAAEALAQFEDANFTYNGSRLTLRKGDPFHQIRVPLNALFSVSLECAAAGDALIVGTNRAAAEEALQAFQSTGGVGDLAADLFRVHAQPTDIAASLGAASAAINMFSAVSGGSLGRTLGTATTLMKEIENVQIDGVSTPDGFSADFQLEWSAE